uniref:Chemosensory protein 13 n=1 Tax=Yemma signatus TaxID=300820 RepID=A0A3G2GRS2_9HEMI|nr:chemosensory protein 13 [Yemma signatus]
MSPGWCLLTACLLASNVLGDDEDDEAYQRIFDDIDVDTVLNNDRVLDSYIHCFIDTGPCSDLAAEIKGRISEILGTVCGSCTEKQKGIFKHSLEVFIPKRTNEWKRILEIYDPKGEAEPKIMDFLKTWTLKE